MKIHFNRALFLSFAISLLLLIVSAIASYVSIGKLISSTRWVDHTKQVIQKLEFILSTLKDAETGQRGYLLTGEEEFLEPYNTAHSRIFFQIDDLKKIVSDNPQQVESAEALEAIITKRLARLQNIIEIKRANGLIDLTVLREGKKYMNEAREVVSVMENREDLLLGTRTSSMNRFASYTPPLIVITSVLSLLITLFSFRKIRTEFANRTKLQEALEQKDAETTHRIDLLQNIAGKIAAGDYDIRLDKAGKDGLGSLSVALNKMAGSLQHSFGLLSKNEWLQKGLAELNEKMLGEYNLKVLSREITDFLVNYTGSAIGAFYLAEERSARLQFIGGAGLVEENVKQFILPGEGIAGRCAQSGQITLLKSIPEEQVIISHASGTIKASHVIAIPLYFEKELMGVIELAGLKEYAQKELELFESVQHSVGTAINGANNRKRLQNLLEETQSQSEELQVQHTELENLNIELEAQAQKLQASEEELRVQQEELQQSNRELEERSLLLEEKNQVITHRNLEIQKKAEELTLSTKYKSEFLANMSHELRTPLNSILLLSRLMSENKDNNLNSEELQYAQVIRSSGEGLLNLINEILDLSKIEAGKMNLEYGDVQLKEVVNDMYLLFTAQITEKKLELRTDIHPDVPAVIHTDKGRVEQILKNLLSNSIKFTSNGYISLDVRLNASDRNYIDFVVKDTGIGIAPDKQQLIFEAFQQEDGSTRRKYGGTGLGLSITRELTRLLKGKITLNSEQGKGAEFIITLPLAGPEGVQEVPVILTEADAAAERIGTEQENKKEGHRQRYLAPVAPSDIPDDKQHLNEDDKVILIVEDDTNFAKILIDFSRKNGYKAISAVTGEQGITFAQQYMPQAILLDIMLPVMDGWEVMEELKSNPATRHIPVHIMSAMEVKKESIAKGAVDYINKPVALDQLRTIFTKLEDVLTKDNKKVLIIEENPKHAKALAYFLESFSINADIKTNIDASVIALQQQDINCVILDMGVPDQGGYETLEVIKQKPGLENLPIIVFTGKNISKSEESRIKRYADSIVVKTAHSYQRILDEVSLFLHIVAGSEENNKDNFHSQTMGGVHEVLKGKTILIADDDVRNIFSLTKLLEQYKVNVISATDGNDALKQLEQNPQIDLILMDMMMPEMDGYEATQRIRQIPRYKKLPILAVTAKAMMGDREKCISVGASDYISKPVDMDQLISLLRVWLYDSPSYIKSRTS